MMDALRKEWHDLAERIDALYEESWSIQTVQHERQTEIKFEVARCRRRITEIADSGVTFDEPSGEKS